MQKLKAYVYCPKECKFIPMRFCVDCDYCKRIVTQPLPDSKQNSWIAQVDCKHQKDCFGSDK